MAREVFFTVVYGDKEPPQKICDLHTFTPSVLKDFRRHRVKNVKYPAAVPEAGQKITGLLVTGLTDAMIQKLDCYEGPDYERRSVRVQVLGKIGSNGFLGEEIGTWVYEFLKLDDLELRDWDFEEFRQERKAIWTRRYLAPQVCLTVDSFQVIHR
ncbi:hypothetical protein E4U52_001368 [Claviceps spartinae]|nr:hypothetical protein E4U52_001368 [Claviceps spartinae]